MRTWLRFLRAVWNAAPEKLPEWTSHVLACARRALPKRRPDFLAHVLLLYAVFVIEMEADLRDQRTWITALLDALQAAPRRNGWLPFENLVGEMLVLAWSTKQGRQRDFRLATITHAAHQLSYPLDAELLIAFWKHV